MIIPLSQRTTDTPNALPTFRQRNFTQASDFVSREGLQLAELGKKATGIAENIALNEISAEAKAEQQARDVADNFRVLDATTELKKHSQNIERGFQQITGAAAFSQDFRKDVESRYKAKQDELFATLSTPEQKLKFQTAADSELLQLRDKAAAHEGQQYKAFQDSTLQAAIIVATDDIALNYRDDKVVERSIADIGKLHKTLAGMYGKSPSFAETQASSAVGKAIVDVTKSLVDSNDFSGATAFLDKYSDKMPPDELIKARNQLQKAASEQIGTTIADNVIEQFKPNIDPNDSDRSMFALWDTESGGKQFTNGKITTSKVGAIGIGQIMPTTAPEAAKLAGVKFDEELFYRKPTGDPVKDKEAEDYNKLLSKAYFNQQLSTFKGDLRKAYAAYNSGPGNVEKAIKNTPKGEDWLDHLVTNPAARAETINYVNVNMQKYNSGARPKKATLAEIQELALSRAGNDLRAREKALQETKRRFDVEHDAVVQREDEVVDSLFQTLRNNKGDLTGLDDQLSQLPADKLKRVTDFAANAAKGTPVKTDWFFYQELVNNPELLAKTNIAAAADKLGETERKQLIRQQAERKGNPDFRSSFERTGQQLLSAALKDAGINPNPKFSDEDGNEILGRVTSRFQELIDIDEGIKQRALSGKELRDVIAQVFAPVEKEIWFGLGREKILKVQATANDTLVISDADKKRIREDITRENKIARDEARAAGRHVPTEPEQITDEDIQAVFRLER